MKKSKNQERNSDEEIKDYLKVHGTHDVDINQSDSDDSHEKPSGNLEQNWGSNKASYYVKSTSNKTTKTRGSTSDVEAARELKEKFDQGLKNEDYTLGLDLNSSDSEEDKKESGTEDENDEESVGASDQSSLTNEENPEIDDIPETGNHDDLQEYVELYETLTEELDEFWTTAVEFCSSLKDTGVIPEILQYYIKQRYHLTNLLVVNLSFALLLGSKQEIENHEVGEVIQDLEIRMKLMKSKEKESGYFELVQKIMSAVESQNYFECVARNTEVCEAQVTNDDNNSKNKKSGKKPKKKTARIVQKEKFARQANKWQTVVPKQRNQNAPYEGERFGIRKDVSRSTKLS